jgi:subtilisin family serine protease
VKPAWAWQFEPGTLPDAPPLDADGPITAEWAWGGATGAGVRVCIVDSGVDGGHPAVRGLDEAVAVTVDADGSTRVVRDESGDACGHGTACAGIVRALAPEALISSVRVLGEAATGTGTQLLAGLEWAVAERFDVINLSLSTTRRAFVDRLHELADDAYFARSTIVASAHNAAVESFPWRFASVISVASHDGDDPFAFDYNPEPPVEFLARGMHVDVAWPGGGTMRVSGNSFATPHVVGIVALVRSKHPRLTPFQLKSVLYQMAGNVAGDG